MKYTLLTAAALATVALAAPAPEGAVSVQPVNTKAFTKGDTLTLELSLQPLLEALFGGLNNIEVPTKNKVKVKRGHGQGAQLVSTVKDLVSKIQGHVDDVGRSTTFMVQVRFLTLARQHSAQNQDWWYL